MNEKLERNEEQKIRAEEINFEEVEQLEEIASPHFLGTLACGC